MIKRKFMQPSDMWARVENENLLYVPVVTIHGADHAHIYLSGQVAREAGGGIVGKGDMRAQIRQTGENIKAALAAAGATLADIVKTNTYVTDMEEFFKHTDVRMEYFGGSMHMGAPTWPPNPQTLVTPRQSRGAPR